MYGSSAVFGRVRDVDSHEMTPTHLWEETFGEIGAVLRRIEEERSSTGGPNSHVCDVVGDVTPVTPETVWETKGVPAPGAFDLERRLAVLDVMGVESQLVFPDFGFIGLLMASSGPEIVGELFRIDPAAHDVPGIARAAIVAHNDWVMRGMRVDPHRMRPVAVIAEETVDDLIEAAGRLIDGGARALWMAAGIPPGGVSPADTSLDPFWAQCEAADVPVVLHIGTEFAFARSRVWNRVPAFARGDNASLEFPLEPHTAATLHFAVENFLTAAILGGVFERHPALRFGVIECGAQWLGPLAERLDQWAEQFRFRLGRSISMPPSAYLVRNVRVTPYCFEPVERFLERHPDLIGVYCYSSDFPHVEGGRSSAERFYDRVLPLGADVVDRFFVRNAELLLPT